MVGPVNGGRLPRQVLSVVNGRQELGSGSVAGSDCGAVDFTREDVVALLNERIRAKDKYSLKVS